MSERQSYKVGVVYSLRLVMESYESTYMYVHQRPDMRPALGSPALDTNQLSFEAWLSSAYSH